VTADRVVTADRWDVGVPCSTWAFTLDSRDVLTVSTGVDEQGCLPADSTPVPRFLGRGLAGTERGVPWPPAKRPLIFLGSDAGRPWWGGVSADEFRDDCWRIAFGNDDGAFREGGVLHLTNGLILPMANDFTVGGAPVQGDPFPLRNGDSICLNAKGEVRAATIWVSY
jgi:hypothetical protein